MQKKRAVVIGSGIGGLGMAGYLAKGGYDVTVLEKNETAGGRANIFTEEGYTFDMGPSWYLMPEVFAHWFAMMGERVEDWLDLRKLSPSYRIFFKKEGENVAERVTDIYSDLEKDGPTLEALEPGSSTVLRTYLRRAKVNYDIALSDFLYKNYDSVFDFLTPRVAVQGLQLSVFTPMHRFVSRFFKREEVQKIMEYTLVFLGSSPYNTPALYSLMTHIDFGQGVFYPYGGLYELIRALRAIGEKHGVVVRTGAEVVEILTEGGRAVGVRLANGEEVAADVVVSNTDIAHTERQLLKKEADRSFTEQYWASRVLAPSGFILYLGVRGKIPSLTHHNLVFSKNWPKNFGEIFDHPQWPTDPSFYVCAPSVTDGTVAPADGENVFVLVPIAAGLEDTEEIRAQFTEKVLDTMERVMDIPDLRERLVVKRTFAVKDFAERYNSLMGTALGLAHTLGQTAIFRPNTVSKKVKNLYYVGANTNPGIGMPICLVSAELVYKRLIGDRSHGPLRQL